jgi:hypothetical protein
MGEYVGPLLFLIVVFIGFGLVHRNRYRGCGDCSDDSCDKSSCEKT